MSETASPSPAEEGALPEIDFGTFVMSLAASALLHLGELPEEGAVPKAEGRSAAVPDREARSAAVTDREGRSAAAIDLPLAKQSIEIIGMLQDKTRGNLTPDESQLLDSVLYDLRLRFVEASQLARSEAERSPSTARTAR